MKSGITILFLGVLIGLLFWWITAPKPVSEDGAPMVSISIPSLTAQAKSGEALFNSNCSSCHGNNAVGRDGFGPPLIHKIYEPSHHGDAAFYLAVQNGVRAHHWPFGNMPKVDGVSERETGLIIEYIRTLQRANGIN